MRAHGYREFDEENQPVYRTPVRPERDRKGLRCFGYLVSFAVLATVAWIIYVFIWNAAH